MKTQFLLFMTAFFMSLSLNTKAQCPVTANAGNDVTICPGGSTQLNATGGSFYSWSPTTGLSNSAIPNPVASPGSSTNYTVTVSSPSGELVTNGNFEAGATGFTSQYINVTGSFYNGSSSSGLYPEGTFAVTNDPAPYHPAFTGSHNDHTTGSGNFMAINGSRPDQHIPLVWRQIVPITPNTLYFFSTWITSIHPTSPATVNFTINVNGVPIGPDIQAPPVGQWVQFYAEWTSPSGATTADIQIVDLNPDAGGNDFGLDDISFTTVCSNTDQVTVNVSNPSASITAGGPTTFCQGGSVTLTANSGSSYLWSPGGATTSSINATASGSYTVTVTNGDNCSAASAPVDVTVNPNPTPTVSAGGPTTFCAGGSVVLTSSYATGNVWSPNGETDAAITVSSSGSYSVTVTDGNGCSGASAPVDVTVNPNPTPTVSANGPTTFCAGGSVVLTSSSATGNVWSPNGETDAAITVSASGSYSVTVTDGNGCSGASAPVDVTVNPNPTPTVSANGPTTFCAGGSVVLTSSSATGNVWSPNGETDATITVSASGSYSVTVTDGNGCSGASAPVDVTVNPNPTPTVSANGPTTFCAGGSVVLTSSSATGNVWSPNGETDATITVSASGSYSVTVTDGNGCSGASAPVDVTVNPNPTPTVSAGGPTTFCAGGSVVLTSSSATGNVWSPNGETDAAITVSASGSYSVTVTDGNGCSGASAPVDVSVNPNPTPTVSANGPTTFCAGGSVVLTSSSATGNVWSPNGETNQSITVSASGSYSVTVTDNGCTGASAPVSVTVNPNPTATITAGGPLSFCQGGSVVLTANSGSGYTYQWAPGGQTSQSITVSSSGSYTVTVRNSYGCSATSAPTVVTVYPIPDASVTASGPLTFCLGSNVTLSAQSGSGYTYLWSPGGQTTQSITVSQNGNYKVKVTGPGGCYAWSAIYTVTVRPNPTATITANCDLTFCQGGSAVLTANSGSGYTWLWSNGATTQSITVTASGTFTVTVRNSYGCTATSAPKTVTVIPTPTATITPNGPLSFCSGGNVTLCANQGSGLSYLWSNGATTQCITVSGNGSYRVRVKNAGGCSAWSSYVNVSTFARPNISLGPDRILYYGYGPTSTTIVPTISGGQAPYTVTWSPSNTVTATASNAGTTITVTATVTDARGCTNTDVVRVCIADVRCGNNNDKVLIWHYPPGNCSNPQLLCVAASAVPAHLAHGDKLYKGNCNNCGKMEATENALEEMTFEASSSVFPNPFNEGLNFDIHVPENTEVRIMIFDDKGSLVASPYSDVVSGELNFSWDATQLASGIYFAKIVTPDNTWMHKLIK